MSKIYLNVPYSQKDFAYKLGAKWDPEYRKWYVTSGTDLTPFRPWYPPISNPRLTIELVPSTCWWSNVRSNVSKSDWDRLRKHTYKKASYRCEICGGVGEKHPVECHEIWNYNESTRVQTLERLIALCPNCHSVKHIGFTQLQGRASEAINHLAKVNNWNLSQALIYVFECFETWQKRSQYEWQLDISYLKQMGIFANLTSDQMRVYSR